MGLHWIFVSAHCSVQSRQRLNRKFVNFNMTLKKYLINNKGSLLYLTRHLVSESQQQFKEKAVSILILLENPLIRTFKDLQIT